MTKTVLLVLGITLFLMLFLLPLSIAETTFFDQDDAFIISSPAVSEKASEQAGGETIIRKPFGSSCPVGTQLQGGKCIKRLGLGANATENISEIPLEEFPFHINWEKPRQKSLIYLPVLALLSAWVIIYIFLRFRKRNKKSTLIIL